MANCLNLSAASNDSLLAAYLRIKEAERRIIAATPLIISPLSVTGLFGSTAIIATMFKRAYRKQAHFRDLMVSISVGDALYCTSVLLFIFLRTFFPLWLTGLEDALLFINDAALMFSDSAAMLVTFQRYICVLKPIFWRSKSAGWKRRLSLAFVVASTSLALLKSVVYLQTPVKQLCKPVDRSSSEDSYNSSSLRTCVPTPVNSIVAFFVYGVPHFILISTVYFTGHVFYVIRRQRRIFHAPPSTVMQNTTTAAVQQRPAATSRSGDLTGGSFAKLLTLLSLGTCVSEICDVILLAVRSTPKSMIVLRVCNDDGHVVRQVDVDRLNFIQTVTALLALESFAHLNTFFLYVFFSRNFRKEFTGLLRCSSS